MSHEEIVVDTTPMANTMDAIAERVRETTVAVVAMQEEVCRAEEEAADQVSSNVTRGFFELQRSQISQKKVLAKAASDAQLLGMQQHGLALNRIKDQMTRDYQRITSRYAALFESLNNALQSRIYAIDQPIAKLTQTALPEINRRPIANGAPIPVIEREVINAETKLTLSRCKNHCVDVLGGCANLIAHGVRLREALDKIVRDTPVEKSQSHFVPVVFMEMSDTNMKDNSICDAYVNQDLFSLAAIGKVKSAFFEHKDGIKWTKENQKEAELIRSALSRKIQEVGKTSPRVVEALKKVLANSKWESLEAFQ